MKKTFSIFALAAAVLCSCNKEDDRVIPQIGQIEEASAVLNVSLGFEDDHRTKAEAYVEAQDYEVAVNKVQIFVFDADGQINMYKNAGTSTSDISINTTTGQKNVWAVVNGPDLQEILTEDELKAVAVDLGANSVDKATGFVMAGYKACDVTVAGATAEITVSRLVARVALDKVTNSLPEGYGAIVIDNVTLINVVGNQNIAGTADAQTWYNKMGRKDGGAEGDIIDGSANKASCEALTFKASGESVANGAKLDPAVPYLFYSFPNSSTSGATGWVNPFTARESRLIIAATIKGQKYYYPVTLKQQLERNKAYTVDLTITGLGSSDPDMPVEKGAITASVTVKGWETGATYSETI